MEPGDVTRPHAYKYDTHATVTTGTLVAVRIYVGRIRVRVALRLHCAPLRRSPLLAHHHPRRSSFRCCCTSSCERPLPLSRASSRSFFRVFLSCRVLFSRGVSTSGVDERGDASADGLAALEAERSSSSSDVELALLLLTCKPDFGFGGGGRGGFCFGTFGFGFRSPGGACLCLWRGCPPFRFLGIYLCTTGVPHVSEKAS